MEGKVLVVCIAVGLLGLLSAALGFAAEATRIKRGEESMYPGGYCYIVKPGVFSGGALMSLASVALGIVYYVALSSSKNVQPWDSQQNQGIAMGHPQIPPRSTEPVFVHEDTHNRLQVP